VRTAVRKKQKYTQVTEETKPKLTGPGSPVRTAHISVHITGYNCGTQHSTNSSDNLPSYPPTIIAQILSTGRGKPRSAAVGFLSFH